MSLLLLLRPLGEGEAPAAPPDVTWPLATIAVTRPRRSTVSRFEIAQGDLLPSLDATLVEEWGSAAQAGIDLTAATGIAFHMRPMGSTTPTTLTGTASIVNAATGEVRYAWGSGDTATPGAYECEWEITWPGNKRMTVPSRGHDTVVITDDIA